MGVTFTKEQQQVIDTRNCNILVSAAAGAGKTAVLVERIITRLTKDAKPIDVDQLLIVTYTEAAAAEMKERIRNAIEAALEERPDDAHLQRQATLIHQANITTIHSFCLSVLRDYFHAIDLDPGFRIGEDGELKLLKRDVVEEVLETWYEKKEPDFLTFVESFATGKDDKKLEEIILQLYEYSRSYPNPNTWLDGCAKQYDVRSIAELEAAPFVKQILKDIHKILGDVEKNLEFAMNLCQEVDGPAAYIGAIDSDLQFVSKLNKEDSFLGMQQFYSKLKWERLGSNRNKEISADKITMVKAIRDECKKIVDGIKADYFYGNMEELQRGMLSAKSNMEVLASLVKDFSQTFTQKKQNKNMIDFGDMEHYALQILTEEQDGIFLPSLIAKELQENYEEIMIDEYQDSNYIQEAILTSVSKVSQGIYNIFMVGDVKQSIYRFRLSRPELFMDKYHKYALNDGKTQRIDLHKNFRSRSEVLDSTNYVFEQIMTESFGGIEYDESAALYVGASYEEQAGNETEICFVETEELDDSANKREIEAKAVARRIKEIVGNHLVIDKKTGTFRKARYGDIVILTRSLKGWTDVFLRILAEEGVPAYSISKEGYFEAREIQMILNYLRVLDNPRQDIPFTAVLTSPFANLESEELALLKSEMEGNSMYERVYAYLEKGNNQSLKIKLESFTEELETFRKKIPYTAIHQLLWEIIEKTGYGNYIAAMPAGEQRQANLEMLVEKAIRFESTSYKGLFHFVRYIEQLRKYDVDYGEANIIDESADVVTIMSIHKSKGLEFPIVFTVGMSKLFNLQDARSNIVIHPELGVGLDFVDVERRVKYPSLLKRMIQKEVQKESVAEELRVLYVAMTRAKEKLILTGTIKKLEEALESCVQLKYRKERALPYTKITKAKCYFDWLIPVLYRSQQGNRSIPLIANAITMEDIVVEQMKEEIPGMFAKEVLQTWDTETVYDKTIKAQIEEQYAYLYPYIEQGQRKQKVSVSELKKQVYLEADEIEVEEILPILPNFLNQESNLTGASRGSAYHKMMELIDYTKSYDSSSLKLEKESMVAQGKMSQEMADCILDIDVLRFLNSFVGKRMKQAKTHGNLYVEQPFVLGETDDSGEVTLVQGIIDVYFQEGDELVILDYKTDRVWSVQELRERYQVQLDYYAKALEQITGKKVKEKIIYSFTLHKEILI